MLRAEKYVNLQGAVSLPDGARNIADRHIILPSIHPKSPRFMIEIFHDDMDKCKTYGFQDVFITFTRNPKWT